MAAGAFESSVFVNCPFDVRDFLRVEAGLPVPGAKGLLAAYVTFQGWLLEKKLAEGHSEEDAIRLPVREKLDEMETWHDIGRPSMLDSR